jgi:hypothetical protein
LKKHFHILAVDYIDCRVPIHFVRLGSGRGCAAAGRKGDGN